MTHVRPFRNADLPVLLDLWIQHWSSIGPPPDVSEARFEQAVLSRTYFQPAALLLAERDGNVEAWCHFARCPDSAEVGVICAICMATTCIDDVANDLMAAVKSQLAGQRLKTVYVGVVRDEVQGYVGLDPIGHGIAVPTSDIRTGELLARHGFEVEKQINRMVVSTTGYRPPVSRAALQFRRTACLQSEPLLQTNRRKATGMSHLDMETHHLVDRGGESLASVCLWISDAEAEVMRPSLVILDIAEAHARGRLDPTESYLIASVIQGLAQRRVDTMETAVDADLTELVSQLGELRFQATQQGARWMQTLD